LCQLRIKAPRPYGKKEIEMLGLDFDGIQASRPVRKDEFFFPQQFYDNLVDLLTSKSPFLKGMCRFH
jgi:hypothetical protein